MRTLALMTSGLALVILASGTVPAQDKKDKVEANDLKTIGLAYHNYYAANNRGPAKAEDLGPYMENNKRLVGLLKSKAITFAYGVGVTDMPKGTSATVLAYEKEIAKNGGLALYGDGSVRKMTAEDFKNATLAKAKK